MLTEMLLLYYVEYIDIFIIINNMIYIIKIYLV